MAIKFTQVVDLSNQRLINVGSPTQSTDVVNKQYVDNVAQGLTWKAAVRAASTGTVTLASPGATIDGVTLTTGDRVLLKDQSTGSQNGIYVFNGAASALTRATDADTAADLAPGSTVSIAEGTVNGDKTYVLVTNAPITLDTTALTFSLMNGGSGPSYSAGNGISTTSNTLTVVAAPSGGLTVGASGVALDPAVAVRKYAANVGDGSSTSINVAHNLNTRDVSVELYANAAPYETVYAEVQRTDLNNVLLVFGSAPASAAYRVVVHG